MKTNIGLKQVTKALTLLTLISGIFFSQSGFAVEFTSKHGKSLYNVEVKENYVTVTSLAGGTSETIYEGTTNIIALKDGRTKYQDSRLSLIDRKDGTAILTLNNGQNIQIELNQ